MTNVYSARGGVVHKAGKSGLPICGALNRPGIPYVETDKSVTCKRCLKHEESTERPRPSLPPPLPNVALVIDGRGVRIA
jgi:hypothetical protein